MSKRDLSKVLTTGTLRQKLQILAEDRARKRYMFLQDELKDREPLLTDKEAESIADTFKTNREVDLFNRYLEYDRTVANALNNLQGLSFEVKMHFSNLRGYLLLWHSIENAELLVNSVLHEIKDKKERERIAKHSIKRNRVYFLLCSTITDEEGYIDIRIDYKKKPTDYNLWILTNNVRKQATETAIRLISWRQAILDYMDERNFNVATYKDMAKQVTKEVYSPIMPWTKYQIGKDKFMEAEDKERINRLKSKYAILPDIESQGVNTKDYNWFKDNFLKDEREI